MRNKVLSIIFLCIIFVVPMVTLVSRILAEESVQKEENDNVFELVDAFLEDIPFRESFAKFNTKFTRKISGSGYIQSTQVILGKNDWLYLKGTQADYEHINLFTEAEKSQILDKLLEQRDMLKCAGIEFVIYIPPNKATIYPENMPATVTQLDSLSRAEDLIEYIRANSDLKVVYPKDELIKAKELAPIYYWSDTHWNEVGGYVGTQVFLRDVFGIKDRLEADMISVRDEYRLGDLARIGSVTDIYRECTLYGIHADKLDVSLKVVDKRVYFIGDSFRENMEHYLRFYVDDIRIVHYDTPDLVGLCEFQPDIVVWEVIERNINKYLEMQLIGGTSANGDMVTVTDDGNLLYIPDTSFEISSDGIRYMSEGTYVTDSFRDVSGKLYYFDNKGLMVSEEFVSVGDATYYFGKSGEAVTEWVESDGKWYYFDDNYQMVRDSWIETDKEEWYYMTGDGSMLTDAYTPDGYYVNENGQWLQ